MTKRRDPAAGTATRVNEIGDKPGILAVADGLLHEIGFLTRIVEEAHADHAREIEAINATYAEKIRPDMAALDANIARLTAIMKRGKAHIFADADVVTLRNGSLIHGLEDKVRIPRDAVELCEELGFDDVIKIAKSLDREAVEKWPDERLFLIGAERKPVETFSYDLKRAKE
jgi:hypothetical protein